jgi:hypothetical protein
MSFREEVIVARMFHGVTFAEFEQALKAHDWTYEYSDDGSVWAGGQAQADQIREMARQLVMVDPKKVETLYNRYGKAGWGKNWKDSAGREFVNGLLRGNRIRAYQDTLGKEVQKFGRTIGQVLKSGWGNNWMGELKPYLLEGRTSKGEVFHIGMSPMRGKITFYLSVGNDGSEFSGEKTITGNYWNEDGIKPSDVARVLDGIGSEYATSTLGQD